MAYTVNLTHRGPQVIECIDLFDDARYGADKLFFRGRFKTAEEVKSQVAISLGDTSFLDAAKIKETYGIDLSSATEEQKEYLKLKLGIGNPLIKMDEVGIEKCPIIALNRHHIPNKKFWNNTPPSDVENPYKASAAVRFSIRVHFRDDFAYIDFGCPWELVDDGKLDTSSDAQAFINEFVLLHCHFISKEDALQIIDSIFDIKLSENTAASFAMFREEDIMTTELVDVDGSIISL